MPRYALILKKTDLFTKYSKKDQKRFLQEKTWVYLNNSKKSFKFFFTVNKVYHAVVGGIVAPIVEYTSVTKKQRNSGTKYLRSS
jgi:hypothetical protein